MILKIRFGNLVKTQSEHCCNSIRAVVRGRTFLTTIKILIVLFSFIHQIIGGKKPKKGQFNGHAKVFIGKNGNNENYNYGLKYKKCIKLYSHMVSQISGNFVNDVLEGDVTIHFIDKTVMKAFAHSGKAIKSSVILRKINTV